MQAIANNLRQAPGLFFATAGDAAEMWANFGDQENVRVHIIETLEPGNEDVFQNEFVDMLQQVVDRSTNDIVYTANDVVNNLPPLSLPEEEAYIRDLAQRSEANNWLGPRGFEYRGSILTSSYEWRSNELVSLFEWIADFVIWNGAKVCAALACDGPCALGVGALKVLTEFEANLEELEQDERMLLLATDLMEMGYWSERSLWSNSLGGMGVIRQAAPPNTPQGEIEQVEFRRGTRQFQMGVWISEYSVAYADVTLVNTGTVTASFFPMLYGHHGPGLIDWNDHELVADLFSDPAGGNRLSAVELAPGEQHMVRLALLEEHTGIDDQPRRGSTVFLKLFARTDQGVYLVDTREERYAPQPEVTSRVTGSVSANVQIRYLSSIPMTRAPLAGEPEWEIQFPLQVDVGSPPDSGVYNVSITANNPFPEPMTVVISQTVPSGTEVLEVIDGAVGSGEIRWYKVIQPNESVFIGYQFRPDGTFGSEITLPSAHISFYDPADDAIVTLSGSERQIALKPPLYAEGTRPDRLQPDTEVTVPITATNLDVDAAHQGTLSLSLIDLEDREIVSATVEVSLPASLTQTYPLSFTAPITPGNYVLKVLLTQSSFTSTVIHTFVQSWGAEFSSSSPDWLGQTTSFTNTTAIPNQNDPLESYMWSFGDGITSTLEYPTHLYAAPGTYTVVFTASHTMGREVVSKTVTIYGLPLASLDSSSPDWLGQMTLFTNTTATIPPGDPTVVNMWSFGDGYTSTLVSPTHIYTTSGEHNVVLTTTNAAGSGVASTTVTILGPPETSLATSSPDWLGQVTFFTNTTVTSGTTTYLWSFGDGMTSTLETPTHIYSNPGLYEVTLTVTNPVGDDVMTDTVTIYSPPAASFTSHPSQGVAPLTVVFTNTTATMPPGDPTLNNAWSLGDGMTSTLQHPTYTYTMPGIYTVVLTDSNAAGDGVVSDTITVYESVSADFAAEPITGARPLTVTFTNQSSGDYTDSLWSFGDGLTSTLENPIHVYEAKECGKSQDPLGRVNSTLTGRI
ncbi:MAG: PKD domain-containing protein [Anaerolineae bacterium]|nr:PKD domain-containing protein [Anaerolineae bacterium]